LILDGTADKGDGQYADGQRHRAHNKQVDIDVVVHSTSPFLILYVFIVGVRREIVKKK
jgi:hypothetical protein